MRRSLTDFCEYFEFGAVRRITNLVETLLDLTFFPGSLPIHEKPPNRSFSNREHAFSLSLPIFEFLNFYKTAGDGGVGRAGISGRGVWGGCDPPGTPPGPPRDPPGGPPWQA